MISTQPQTSLPASARPAPGHLAVLATDRATPGLWWDAWHRLRRNRLAATSLLYLAFLALVAVAAPTLAPHNPVQADARGAGSYRQAAWLDDPDPRYDGAWTYLLGTDAIGRDVFSRLLYGSRVSLVVGLVPTALILLIGVPVGLAAGYGGRRLDTLLMRLTDVVYAFPALLFFIVMQVSLRDTAVGDVLGGLLLLFLTLSVVGWTGLARLVRGEVLALKRREFVAAARAGGASPARIVARHLLPNAAGPILVAAAFLVPGAIIAEAVLSYLGIGVRPAVDLDAPFPTSWGQMILDGSAAWQSQPWLLIGPSLAIALTTLACTFVGDGLRDALDPRERR